MNEVGAALADVAAKSYRVEDSFESLGLVSVLASRVEPMDANAGAAVAVEKDDKSKSKIALVETTLNKSDGSKPMTPTFRPMVASM